LTVLALVAVQSLALVCALMAVLWAIHLALRNAAIVDAGWAAGLPIIAVFATWRLGGTPRGWLLAGMVTIWGLRLAGFLLRARVFGHPEEGRYVALRQSWKTHLSAKFFVFFQAQAVLDLVLAVPFLIVAADPRPVTPALGLASVLWAGALLGEATADRQLDRFKHDPANRGAVCAVGLWRYSRHPNYFFEWLIWVAYAGYASGSPGGWVGWISPALILFFLLRFTGIPATEAQALRSRGEAYRAYQRETSAFVPWFPRREASR
jgi:steroid 5-alpha reductase family enzyme